MSFIDPPATAGGTDLLQVQLLTFKAKPSHFIRKSDVGKGSNRVARSRK